MSPAPIGSIDTSVIVPPAIRAAAERADALQLDHRQRMGLEPPPVAEQPPQAPPPPEQQAQPPQPPQAPPQEQPPQQQPQNQQIDPNADVADDQNAAYEHRYRSMKGRHDALKARTDRNTQGLLQRVGDLEAQLEAALRAGPAPQQQPQSAPSGFSEDDEATWGTDMLSMIDRVAERKLAAMRGELAQVAGQFTRKQMFDHLDANLPAWRKLNEDQDFLAWLNLRDEGTGAIRHELLKDAFAKGEPQRVAYFFRSFISDGALPAPSAGQPSGLTPPAQPAPSNRLDLASLAAPGRAGSSPPPPASDAKQTYRSSEIGRFFSDKARGAWRGREAEADNLERDIFLAQAENRVVSG